MIDRPPTLTTWQDGSMATVGASVACITWRSSRLSRISSESTWWRPSTTSVGTDDRPHVLAVEGPGEVSLLEAVHDLDRSRRVGVLHELQHAALDHHVVEVHLLDLGDGGLRYERRTRVLLGV